MNRETQHFSVRASASRLEKGLLAIPQRFRDWFPKEKRQIQVVFDDEKNSRTLTYHPYDPIAKENRIFGLASWYSKREVREGDLITISVEDPAAASYRIALDRYVRERQEQKARHNLQAARTDSEAQQELSTLSLLSRKRLRVVALEELLRIAQSSERQPRAKVIPASAEHHEGVPAGTRVLLRELHAGKCQICGFSFDKRNGEPYFEIHHLEPEIGHHPTNLLVVCPNCHAQLEHATVTDFRWTAGWLVGVTISGRHIAVRQPFAHDSLRRALLGLVIAVALSQVGRLLECASVDSAHEPAGLSS